MSPAKITCGIDIARHPGVVQITFLAPLTAIEKAGLLPFVHEQYGIGYSALASTLIARTRDHIGHQHINLFPSRHRRSGARACH